MASELGEELTKELIEACLRAKENAYAPYSHFRVGAAILTSDNKIFTGCNVENCAYPMCTCAERCAAVKAVSEGSRKFKAVAVCTDSDECISPCGNCRQILCEFGLDQIIILARSCDVYEVHTLKSLLPLAFTPAKLETGQK